MADYRPLSEFIVIPTCRQRACVNVTIIDDNVIEEAEIFSITLERTPALPFTGIRLNRTQGQVTILDSKYIAIQYICCINLSYMLYCILNFVLCFT